MRPFDTGHLALAPLRLRRGPQLRSAAWGYRHIQYRARTGLWSRGPRAGYTPASGAQCARSRIIGGFAILSAYSATTARPCSCCAGLSPRFSLEFTRVCLGVCRALGRIGTRTSCFVTLNYRPYFYVTGRAGRCFGGVRDIRGGRRCAFRHRRGPPALAGPLLAEGRRRQGSPRKSLKVFSNDRHVHWAGIKGRAFLRPCCAS